MLPISLPLSTTYTLVRITCRVELQTRKESCHRSGHDRRLWEGSTLNLLELEGLQPVGCNGNIRLREQQLRRVKSR